MPGNHSLLGQLNYELSPARIDNTAKVLEAKKVRKASFKYADLCGLLNLPKAAGFDATTCTLMEKNWRDFHNNEMPECVSIVFKEVLWTAIKKRTPVLVQWNPGYDFKISVTESPAMPIGKGKMSKPGICIQIVTRYPGDTHPATGR